MSQRQKIWAVLSYSLVVLGIGAAAASSARAELRPDRVLVADGKKSGTYLRDGMVTGGDAAVNDVVVKDIRRAVNPGFERIVIDLEGTHNGEPLAIARPPYFQVAVTPDERRLVFSVWGKPKVALDPIRVKAGFKKSKVIKSLSLLPSVDSDVWTFVAEMNGDNPVEVFELTNPVRIIVDVRTR